MMRTLLTTVIFVLLTSAGASLAAETVNPHAAANECLTTPCETTECQEACDLVCASCHDDQHQPADFSLPTPWNPSGQELDKFYGKLTTPIQSNLYDICTKCHSGHFTPGVNHPVDIAYLPSLGENDLVLAPEGPLLVCAPGEDCKVRCVTCHALHPSENQGQQLAGLLRVRNQGSALCVSCHNKGGGTAAYTMR